MSRRERGNVIGDLRGIRERYAIGGGKWEVSWSSSTRALGYQRVRDAGLDRWRIVAA
jgi:hypothetical protein